MKAATSHPGGNTGTVLRQGLWDSFCKRSQRGWILGTSLLKCTSLPILSVFTLFPITWPLSAAARCWEPQPIGCKSSCSLRKCSLLLSTC